MMDAVLQGIAMSISECYPGYLIYKERIEQNLKPPCFYLYCPEVSQKNGLMGRLFRSQPFQIVYFPDGGQSEMLEVMDALLIALRQIALEDGSVLNGSNLSARVADDTVMVFVNYDVFLRELKTEVPMDGIEIKGGLTNE